MASAPRLSGGSSGPTLGVDEPGAGLPGPWWLRLLVGIAWIIVALIILQFDSASATTVGVIVGIMFLVAGCQELMLAATGARTPWVGYVFGGLFVVAGLVALLNPEDTFAGVADILGFLFLAVAVTWIVQAFLARGEESFWWVLLVAGVVMLALAFWTGGQFFFEKVYVLLVVAGIWALMMGLLEIVRAFALRSARG